MQNSSPNLLSSSKLLFLFWKSLNIVIVEKLFFLDFFEHFLRKNNLPVLFSFLDYETI